ncbi:hypothetical protein ES702_00883 [subsurface metagenome]
MEDIFVRVLLGHLFGDYLLQSKDMAIKKSETGIKGLGWCTLHCIIYTFCVCLFLWKINPLVIVLVFLSHWPIDRWSLASWWLKFIGGRDFIAAFTSKDRYRDIDLSFSCLVYAVVDNTMHFTLLWLIVRLISFI